MPLSTAEPATGVSAPTLLSKHRNPFRWLAERSLLWWAVLRVEPLLLCLITFGVGLLCIPWIYLPADMLGCILPWSKASGGNAPWEIYAKHADCNYPPVLLYIFTLAERLRILANGDQFFHISIIKFLMTIPHLIGGLFVYSALRPMYGVRCARIATGLYALSIPLLVNAPLWGQADTLIVAPMFAAAAFLAGGFPGRAGAAFGIALAVKLQPICLFPILLIYCWRRFSLSGTLRAAAGAVAVVACLALPFFLQSNGQGLIAAYTKGVDFYPYRSAHAYNLWGFLNSIEMGILGLTENEANYDFRILMGPLTHKHLGLFLLGTYNLILVGIVCWRPHRRVFLLALALSALGFFILPTQMHERYIVPASVLLILPVALAQDAGERRRLLLLYAGVAWTATLNQLLVLIPGYLALKGLPTVFFDFAEAILAGMLSLINCLLFIWGNALLIQMARKVEPAKGPTPSEVGPVLP